MAAELVDKCVGSQIWVIMNNSKGRCIRASDENESWADGDRVRGHADWIRRLRQ